MAAADATPYPIYGQAFRFYGLVKDLTTGNPITGGLTDLAVTISKDGAAFGAPSQATPIAEIGTTGFWSVDLNATDMTATCVIAQITASNTDAVYQVFSIHPLSLAETLAREDGATVKRFERYMVQVLGALLNNETIDNTTFARTLYKADGTTPMFAGTVVDGDATTPSERGALENI